MAATLADEALCVQYAAHAASIKAAPLLDGLPKTLTLCSPVRSIDHYTMEALNGMDPMSEDGSRDFTMSYKSKRQQADDEKERMIPAKCIPYTLRPFAVVLECTEPGRGKMMRTAGSMLTRVTGQEEDEQQQRLPRLSPKLQSRDKSVVMAVAATCRNALLFFDASNAPLLFDDVPLVLHLRATLMDESVLGAGYAMRAFIWPLVQMYSTEPEAHPIEGARFLRGGAAARGLPCYLVSEWRVDLCEPKALLSRVFPWSERSVLDDCAPRDLDGSASLLPSGIHGFYDTWNFSDSQNATVGFLKSKSCIPVALDMFPPPSPMVDNEDAAEDTPHRLVEMNRDNMLSDVTDDVAIIDMLASCGIDGMLLAAQDVRGPVATAQIYAQLLGQALRDEMTVPEDPRDGTVHDKAPRLLANNNSWHFVRDRIIEAVTIWTLLVLVPNHARYDAALKNCPTLITQLSRCAFRILKFGRGSAIWREFIEQHSVGLIVFPWANEFTLDALSTDLWTAVAECMADVVAAFTPEVLSDVGIIKPPLSMDDSIDEVLGRAQEAVVRFRDHPEFRYQRLSIEYYADKMIDRTRAKKPAPPAALVDRLRSSWYDDEDSIPDSEAFGADDTENGGDGNNKNNGGRFVKQERDDSYYALRGQHGQGHLYAVARPTDSPFDTDSGRYLAWLKQNSFLEPDPPLDQPVTHSLWNLWRTQGAPELCGSVRPITRNINGQQVIAIRRIPGGASPIVVVPEEGGTYRVMALTDLAAAHFVTRSMARTQENAQLCWFPADDESVEADDMNLTQAGKILQNERTRIWRENRAQALDAVLQSGTIRGPHGSTNTITLSPEQRQVMRSLDDTWVSILTGGAGTGKSTMIALMMEYYMNELDHMLLADDELTLSDWLRGASVVLLTAYGTPASNFVTDYSLPAATLHYASAVVSSNFWNDDRRIIKSSSQSRARAETAIVDEMSVITLDHFVMLFNAFPNLTKIICVGDMNQMRSIERGNMGDALLAAFGSARNVVQRLSYNYRLTVKESDGLNWENRTHAAFDSVLAGAVIGNKAAFGLYTEDGPASELPSICYMPDWSDIARVRKAMLRSPMLLLSHVSIDWGVEKSLTASCERLVALFGSRAADWHHVQILTQRNEDMKAIIFAVTRKLFPNIPVNPSFNTLPWYDVYVGERVVFSQRTAAFTPRGEKVFIYKNAIRIIQKIEDAFEERLSVQAKEGDHTAAGKTATKPKARERIKYKDAVQRKSTQQYIQSDGNAPSRRRIVTFTNGQYVAFSYRARDEVRDIKVMRRGVCATNASMEGLGETTIVLFIRVGVSFTFDRNELYTALTRMRRNVVIISVPDSLEKVARQLPPVRRNPLHEFFSSVSPLLEGLPASTAGE